MLANVSSSTSDSAVEFGVATSESRVGTSVPTIVPRNTASTRPRTARNAALGSSASRRVASSGDGPPSTRVPSRASAQVSHGPAMTRPIMLTSSPG